MDEEQRIRERAHAIWEREGRPDGRSEEFWLRAREEILGEDGGAPGSPAGGGSAAKPPKPRGGARTKAGERPAAPDGEPEPRRAREKAGGAALGRGAPAPDDAPAAGRASPGTRGAARKTAAGSSRGKRDGAG